MYLKLNNGLYIQYDFWNEEYIIRNQFQFNKTLKGLIGVSCILSYSLIWVEIGNITNVWENSR